MALNPDQIKQFIIEECENMKQLLLEKNESYGNSVFSPIGIFSKADPEEQLCIRLDDKLKRLQRGKEFQGDDTVKDLIGYLHLLRIWRRIRGMQAAENNPGPDLGASYENRPVCPPLDPTNIEGRPIFPPKRSIIVKDYKR